MTPYEHKVQYYETDGMGIVHHSNYIRWFEDRASTCSSSSATATTVSRPRAFPARCSRSPANTKQWRASATPC